MGENFNKRYIGLPDHHLIERYCGQVLTTSQVKSICHYSPSTFIKDVEVFKRGLIECYSRGKWKVK